MFWNISLLAYFWKELFLFVSLPLFISSFAAALPHPLGHKSRNRPTQAFSGILICEDSGTTEPIPGPQKAGPRTSRLSYTTVSY